jgi:putative ABC transport system permease protein
MINVVITFYSGMINGLTEVWAHKFRSLLSMMGIILGVAALVAMVGVVRGMIGEVRDYFERTGGITRLQVETRQPPDEQSHIAHLSPGMTFNDVDAVRLGSPLVTLLDPEVSLNWRRFTHAGVSDNAPLRGVLPDRREIQRLDLREGRFIGDLDVIDASPVVVLGGWLGDRFFPDGEAVGRRINIHGQTFRIIGVVENLGGPQGGGWFWMQNRTAYIPITTAMKRFSGNDRLNSLNVQVANVAFLEDAIGQVENILLQTHRGIEDFAVTTMEEQLAEFRRIEGTFTLTLGGVAGISLLVGGIGIMNVMLAVINERIREIGVRKAVGARGSDIFIQFLAEAVVISVVGGLIGVMVSVGLVGMMQALIEVDQFRIALSPPAMLAGFLFSVTIGIASGIYPALRAARMNVIDALRYE